MLQKVQVTFQEKPFKHCKRPAGKQYQIASEKNFPGLDFLQVIPVQQYKQQYDNAQDEHNHFVFPQHTNLRW